MSPRHEIYEVQLRPVMGDRFQATGFPDIGAAQYERPIVADDGSVSWEPALLVESAQSVANRLEAAAWDSTQDVPEAVVAGLPWVRVVNTDGEFLTSSRLEAHRLASAFIREATTSDGTGMLGYIGNVLDLQDDRPLNAGHIARAVAGLDPFSLLHGVFFNQKEWVGQPKLARAVTGVIEAQNVRPVYSGGVKRDEVRHSIGENKAGAAEGYGSVPFQRVEFVAASITAQFVIDTKQLTAYGLSEAATATLVDVARWEIRRFLNEGLRLRTACDFKVVGGDEELASEGELAASILKSASEAPEFNGGEVLTVTWSGDKGKRSK